MMTGKRLLMLPANRFPPSPCKASSSWVRRSSKES
ncbi:hypothetical protein H206_05593 [Candidatus Electrothrix aarhusensis]|uniref:Uncharacterized protein n=1 Tax=Candidatus Electrothrix aarhusensis TaxID=1859131 RepID=A0A3S3RA22_9BACT|nr:hypothetical protein H206_05593 [Candidatus Electrothrix aarhusensis]